MEDTFNGLQGGGGQPEEGDLEIWVDRTRGLLKMEPQQLEEQICQWRTWDGYRSVCGPASVEFQRQSQDAR